MREGPHANTNDLWYGSTKRVTWRTKEKAPGVGLGLFMYGALGGIRTHDPCLRRAMRYRNLGWWQVLLSASKCRVARLPTYNLIDSL